MLCATTQPPKQSETPDGSKTLNPSDPDALLRTAAGDLIRTPGEASLLLCPGFKSGVEYAARRRPSGLEPLAEQAQSTPSTSQAIPAQARGVLDPSLRLLLGQRHRRVPSEAACEIAASYLTAAQK